MDSVSRKNENGFEKKKGLLSSAKPTSVVDIRGSDYRRSKQSKSGKYTSILTVVGSAEYRAENRRLMNTYIISFVLRRMTFVDGTKRSLFREKINK